jgi:hypothetical protein
MIWRKCPSPVGEGYEPKLHLVGYPEHIVVCLLGIFNIRDVLKILTVQNRSYLSLFRNEGDGSTDKSGYVTTKVTMCV